MQVFAEAINIDDIALAAFQGRIAAGKTPAIAAAEAWQECVDFYLDERDKYLVRNPNIILVRLDDDIDDDNEDKGFIVPPST